MVMVALVLPAAKCSRLPPVPVKSLPRGGRAVRRRVGDVGVGHASGPLDRQQHRGLRLEHGVGRRAERRTLPPRSSFGMLTVMLLGDPRVPIEGAEREIEKASAGSKSESGRRGTVIVLVAALAAKARIPLVGVKSSPGPVPPVAVPLLVVKLTRRRGGEGPGAAHRDHHRLGGLRDRDLRRSEGERRLEVVDGEDGRAGRAQGGAAAGRVQGDHDRLVAFGQAVGHGVDVDRLHGLAGGKGQRGGGEGVVGAAPDGGARDRVAHGDAARHAAASDHLEVDSAALGHRVGGGSEPDLPGHVVVVDGEDGGLLRAQRRPQAASGRRSGAGPSRRARRSCRS